MSEFEQQALYCNRAQAVLTNQDVLRDAVAAFAISRSVNTIRGLALNLKKRFTPMAENENTAAVAAPASGFPTEAGEEEYQYSISIEDAGPATKRVVVEIPKDRIDQKLSEQYKDLRQQAAIPGFRPGHAPQKLIEKRFSSDVKEQVRRNLISESYEQAVEKNNLQVIGEPQFDDPDAIQLKEDQPLKYTFQIEVQPDFTVPDLGNLVVKKPKIQVTEENVQQALQNLKE